MNEKWGLSILYTNGHKEIIDLSETEKNWILGKGHANGEKSLRLHQILADKHTILLADTKATINFGYVIRAKVIKLSGYNPLNDPDYYENPLS